MEKQKGHDLKLRKFGGNVNDFAGSGDSNPNQQNWISGKREPFSFYEFLTENSTFVQKAPTHVFNSISASAPVTDPCLVQDMDPWKFNPYPYNALPNLTCSEQYDEMNSFNKFSTSQNQTPTQSHSSLTQEPSGATSQRRKGSASVHVTRRLASSTDRKRREKIAQRVKALQDLLPNPVEGSQMAVMDEIIGYVKNLQQQMKDLSRSKLGNEFRSCPSIFNEGNQHYEQTMKEPLEVTFAKLLKVDTAAALMFLESKGLFVKPVPLADSLQ